MIGLITFHCAYNYGAALQAYALQTKLNEIAVRMGSTGGCKILNYYYEEDMRKYDIRWDKGIKVVGFDFLTLPQCYSRKKAYKKFQKKYFVETKRTTNWEELREIGKEFDVLICGSDQIWNLNMVGGVNPAYFLKFANAGQKKISYAPSISCDKISEKYAADLKETLRDFTAISVRESGSDQALSSIIERNVDVVLDPVLLVERSVWDDLISDYQINLPKKYIFFYSILQSNKDAFSNYVEKLAEEMDAEIVYFSKYHIFKKRYAKNIFSEDPRAFVAAIKNAEFIVGDSFHSSAFSIVYHKPFMGYSGRESRLRLDSLFSNLGIEGHFLGENEYHPINYNQVEKRLRVLRADSLKFLEDALKR